MATGSQEKARQQSDQGPAALAVNDHLFHVSS
jgi:hypothetical protein